MLYHGSPLLVDQLEPRRAGDAIYATHELSSAIAFALPIGPDAAGNCLWSLARCEGDPRITIHSGRLDPDAVGYIYELASEGFERVDDWQWTSLRSVRPLGRRTIRAIDYLRWISEGSGTPRASRS